MFLTPVVRSSVPVRFGVIKAGYFGRRLLRWTSKGHYRVVKSGRPIIWLIRDQEESLLEVKASRLRAVVFGVDGAGNASDDGVGSTTVE